MFYIDHGTLLDGKIFDAKVYQYVSAKDTLSTLKMSIEDSEWMRDSCHPNGYFRCNRCYRKHFIVNNFDLLCDGCVNTLKNDFPNSEPTKMLLNWTIDDSIISDRIKLRDTLDKVFKADALFYNSNEIVIVKDLLKNNGNLQVRYKDSSNCKNPFILNVYQISYRYKDFGE